MNPCIGFSVGPRTMMALPHRATHRGLAIGRTPGGDPLATCGLQLHIDTVAVLIKQHSETKNHEECDSGHHPRNESLHAKAAIRTVVVKCCCGGAGSKNSGGIGHEVILSSTCALQVAVLQRQACKKN